MSITSKRASDVLGMAVTFNGCGRCTSDELKEAVHAAIAALREKAEREDPKPLTLEELRQMDGEPFYVKLIAYDNYYYYPAILDCVGGVDVAIWCGSESDYLDLRYYGETFLAYRHKPREGRKCAIK